MRMWTRFIGSGYGPVAGSCEHGNNLSYSVGQKFCDHLFKRNCVSWSYTERLTNTEDNNS